MMDKLNLIDFEISNKSMEYKREFIYALSYSMKKIHESGGCIENFEPKNIYVDVATRMPSFSSLSLLSKYGDIESIKQADVVALSNLALCLYLDQYDLNSGLLNLNVLVSNFDNLKSYFPEEDVDYYSDIFRTGFREDNEIKYFCDYIDKKQASSGKETINTLVKATEQGKAYANLDESAFSNKLILVAATLLVVAAIIFFIVYFLEYFA